MLFGVKIPTGANRFSGHVLERAIKSALADLGYSEDELMWDDSLFEEVPDSDLPYDSIWADVHSNIITESLTAKLKGSEASLPNKDATGAPFSNVADEPPSLESGPFDRQARASTWKIHPRRSVHRKASQKGCRGFVLTSFKNALGLPKILSTYDANDRQTRIWEALRATSAAPAFFEEIQFGTPKLTYVDGGVGFSNPCVEVDYAAKALWEGRSIGIIVSVGTGLQSIPSANKLASWIPFGLATDTSLASALAGMATSTARVDNEMKRMYYNTSTKYYRFDVDCGLANISLEQWMKEDEMVALTEQYMREAKQVRCVRAAGEIITKLSAPPSNIEISATHFRVGMRGKGLMDQSFQLVQVDFKTGLPLGVYPQLGTYDASRITQSSTASPSGEGRLAIDSDDRLRKGYPVAEDLDYDGRREEAAVYQCVRADNICLRSIKTGIPQGRYRVRFIVSFQNSKYNPPGDLVFSVGKPFDTKTFASRFVDVRITPDVVPVLLHPDAVRVMVGSDRYVENREKGWVEIEGDMEVSVGLDGALGFVISKRFEENVWVDGWSFGGVRLEPILGMGRG